MQMRRLVNPVQLIFLLVAATLLFCATGCFTVGHDFPTDQVSAIKIGKTTQNEIRSMFGSPWRVGIEDGARTWTYGKYRYSVFSAASTRDLVVRFDEQGIVTSYSFNTTDHQK